VRIGNRQSQKPRARLAGLSLHTPVALISGGSGLAFATSCLWWHIADLPGGAVFPIYVTLGTLAVLRLEVYGLLRLRLVWRAKKVSEGSGRRTEKAAQGQ